MTQDNRIPCPSFDVVLFALLDVVSESPHHRTSIGFIDSEGYPHDLAGHVLNRVDAPIQTAAAGHLDNRNIALKMQGVPGTPRTRAHLPLIWNRLFLWGNGEDTPYDGRFVMFPEMARLRRPAEDYLVMAFLSHITVPFGRGARDLLDWKGEAIRGIKSFRRFLLSPTSGFLVQTHGSHEDLLQYVDQLTTTALVDLSK
ncbi:hypothetical protein QDW47_gp27 [Microbacterium phage AnnaLie]|uniref:hypothetical protein n=1 Tax=Microbacterium phage SansAfet TaxID=2653275 RepID=UPI0012A87698|nr:hypothetical protein QDW46_gp26 [Microbacterium phage SansAfet]YP_010754076.1 hypothetical protein QDW47_gp27 [Microbacterium phage AnnaLie]QFP94282.1 hypothetical protein SEA_SANSAFET_26 [Microbacterium phage SansAfet]QOC59476.1 hypothetical protein SEA_ANNALIE_27 [Microbacterium phage AnnaLie]QUE25505.1 hypothetical protein SEA_BELMONTSKP_27 [Microbacterium phage BelmontSKP]